MILLGDADSDLEAIFYYVLRVTSVISKPFEQEGFLKSTLSWIPAKFHTKKSVVKGPVRNQWVVTISLPFFLLLDKVVASVCSQIFALKVILMLA